MNTATAILSDGRKVEYEPESIGEGSSRRVHWTADKTAVISFFTDPHLPWQQSALRRMRVLLERYNPAVDPVYGSCWTDLLCWPLGIVVAPLPGVVYSSHPAGFYFKTGRFAGKPKNLNWFISPRLRGLLPEGELGTWLSCLQMSITLARIVSHLHQLGLVLADLGPNDLLVDPLRGKVYFVNHNAIVIPGEPLDDEGGTPGYVAPELVATVCLPADDPRRQLPSMRTDLHALAVLIYELLLKRHPLRGPKLHATTAEEDERLAMGADALFIEHPTDASNRPAKLKVRAELLGPYLFPLVLRAFVDGLHEPERRPTAEDWEHALCRTADLLIPCSKPDCPDRWYVLAPPCGAICPCCDTRLESPIPVFRLSGGAPSEIGIVTAWSGRSLNTWHVTPSIRAHEAADRMPVARVVRDGTQWLLINDRLEHLVSPAGNAVPKGSAIALAEGKAFWLCRDSRRRALVEMMYADSLGFCRRFPIYWLCDCSSSMAGDPIDALTMGLRSFVTDLQCDPQALETAWLSVITFGASARLVMPLTPMSDPKVPALTADSPVPDGNPTVLGQGLRLLLDRLDLEYQESTPFSKGDFKPLVFVLLDGSPTDSWESAAEELKRRFCQVVGVAAGPRCDAAALGNLTDEVVKLQDARPGDLFRFFRAIFVD